MAPLLMRPMTGVGSPRTAPASPLSREPAPLRSTEAMETTALASTPTGADLALTLNHANAVGRSDCLRRGPLETVGLCRDFPRGPSERRDGAADGGDGRLMAESLRGLSLLLQALLPGSS